MTTRNIVLLCLLVPVAAVASDTITPGLYRTTVTMEMTMGDMKMPPRTEERDECLTAEDVEAGPNSWMPDNDDSCEMLKYEFGGGKLAIEMVCRMEEGEGTMVSTGTYTDDSYEMNSRMTMSAQGMQMETNSRVVGQRVSDC